VLSYRHAFHAGNHADILKHLAWLGVISHLKRKPKPFVLFDTHAGGGEYPLSADYSQQNKEYLTGMSPLQGASAQNTLLDEYLKLNQPIWNNDIYPGSPRLLCEALRTQDHAHLMELHPAEIDSLQQCVARHGNARIAVHHRNGLEGLVAMTPPKPNRGAVLIDPPYEQIDEYPQVADNTAKVLQRWANGQIVVWYPLLSERAAPKARACQTMLETLAAAGKTCFTAELVVAENTHDAGMYGSGVCIINPAFQLDEHLSEAMQEVCKLMGSHARFSLTWRKTEAS